MKYYIIDNTCTNAYTMYKQKICIVQYNGFPRDISKYIMSRITDTVKNNDGLALDSVVNNKRNLPSKTYGGLVHLFYFDKDNFYDLDKLIELVRRLADEWFERINILVDGNKEEFNQIQSQILLGLSTVSYNRLKCINSKNSVIPIISVCYNKDEFLDSVCNGLIFI